MVTGSMLVGGEIGPIRTWDTGIFARSRRRALLGAGDCMTLVGATRGCVLLSTGASIALGGLQRYKAQGTV